jgi:hypothetical protein
MSRSGVIHVRPSSLEPSLLTGYVQSRGLVTEELGWVRRVWVGSRTCPKNASRTRLRSQIGWVNPGLGRGS